MFGMLCDLNTTMNGITALQQNSSNNIFDPLLIESHRKLDRIFIYGTQLALM